MQNRICGIQCRISAIACSFVAYSSGHSAHWRGFFWLKSSQNFIFWISRKTIFSEENRRRHMQNNIYAWHDFHILVAVNYATSFIHHSLMCSFGCCCWFSLQFLSECSFQWEMWVRMHRMHSNVTNLCLTHCEQVTYSNDSWVNSLLRSAGHLFRLLFSFSRSLFSVARFHRQLVYIYMHEMFMHFFMSMKPPIK